MEIMRQNDAIHTTKPDGTNVWYYMFPEYEIHYNTIPPGTTQVWHHHNVVEEVLLIVQGELEAKWMEKEQEKHSIVRKGDLIRVEHTSHTFVNNSDKLVTFVVVKVVLDDVSKQEVIKTDKHLDRT